MTKFLYKQINNKKQMGGKRNKSDIKFIVVHYTGNTSKGANADAHYRYLQNATRYGSAHYYVDSNYIIQTIGDTTTAWSVGDNQGYGRALNGCTNYNSISIEMCVNSDGDFEKTLFNTIELVKNLLAIYPNARVCRHYDVTRKNCPAMMSGRNNEKWNDFLKEITKNRRMIVDLSKTSDCKMVNKNTKVETKNTESAETKSGRTKVANEGKYSVMVNCPGDVLKVRENPDASATEVSSYRHGSKIYVNSVWKGNGETWYEIPYKEGKVGYVSAKFCKGIR